MKIWFVVGRPGYFGKEKSKKYAEYDKKFGPNNWGIFWKVGTNFTDFLGACKYYEDAYCIFLNSRKDVLAQLVNEASDVYDDDVSNVKSEFDYTVQETGRTHIQDIAIRNSAKRLGIQFRGRKLIQIRHDRGTHPLSMILSPGRVPFHMPEIIEQPELTGWWNPGSVESFYQSNKFLRRVERF